jgi:hypothetical protein
VTIRGIDKDWIRPGHNEFRFYQCKLKRTIIVKLIGSEMFLEGDFLWKGLKKLSV